MDWARKEKEPAEAFAAFQVFLHDRTKLNAKWVDRFEWFERARAYDEHTRIERARKLESDRAYVAHGLVSIAGRSLQLWDRFIREAEADAKQSKKAPRPPVSPQELSKLAEAGIRLSVILADAPKETAEAERGESVEERRERIRRARVAAVMGDPDEG